MDATGMTIKLLLIEAPTWSYSQFENITYK